MEKITKNIIIQELLEKYPDSIEILMMYGMQCVGCRLAGQETLEEGMKSHGIEHELDEILKDLNSLIESEKD